MQSNQLNSTSSLLLPKLPTQGKRRSKVANFMVVALPALMLSIIMIGKANAEFYCANDDLACQAQRSANIEQELDKRLAAFEEQQAILAAKAKKEAKYLKQAHNICIKSAHGEQTDKCD